MKLKLAIFDYDGLLVNTEKLAFIAEKKVLAKFGKKLTKKNFDKYLGFPVIDTLRGHISDYKLTVSVKDLSKKRMSIITHLLKSNLKLMPGTTSLLDYLRKKGIDSVIASSGEQNYVKFGLKKLHIAHYFKNITCVNEVRRGKPNPALFLKALQKNQTKAHEAIVFEDSISGIRAARKAGIFCVAILRDNNKKILYHQANIIFNSLNRVKSFLEKNSLFKN